ncbi:unnamed protein product [Caenorhabditis sp. 36 PRJEB53466]|nr:unnamed protein product [Caenorhabditis sp. 36 PRJEB53466]
MSAQASSYIRNITECVVSNATTDLGITTRDWSRSLYLNSPWSKQQIQFVTHENLKDIVHTVDKYKNIDLRDFNHHEKQQIINTLNMERWKTAVSAHTTRDDLEDLHPPVPQLNLLGHLIPRVQ